MASGLIGTSTALSINSSFNQGTAYTYTVPASGVRYAIVSYNYTLSVTPTAVGGNPAAIMTGTIYARIDGFSGGAAGGGHLGPSESEQRGEVVLAPGQQFQYQAQVFGTQGDAFASMTASVLEII